MPSLPRERYRDRDENLYATVDAYHLVENLEHCLQCGKCAGICPVASLSPSYNPRQIISDVLSGSTSRWLKSEEIWRCFWCAGCYTVCPVDIHFPLLMMQLRYLAVASLHGLKYIAPFKRFALRAREDGLTFAPGSAKGRERIMGIRGGIGLTPWPEVSEKAREEYRALFDMTGSTEYLDRIREEEDQPLELTYLEGRITGV
jgi:heterodisulfide reductase subunit C